MGSALLLLLLLLLLGYLRWRRQWVHQGQLLPSTDGVGTAAAGAKRPSSLELGAKGGPYNGSGGSGGSGDLENGASQYAGKPLSAMTNGSAAASGALAGGGLPAGADIAGSERGMAATGQRGSTELQLIEQYVKSVRVPA